MDFLIIEDLIFEIILKGLTFAIFIWISLELENKHKK